MNETLELANSLNRGEQKLITQVLKQEGKNQLYSVFLIINRGGSLIDICSELGKSKQQSAVLLHQLKENILTKLTQNRQYNTVENELRNAINEIEFLKDRFLYEQSLKRIKTLKPKLLKHERFQYLQEILMIEVEIYSFLLTEKAFQHKLQLIINEYENLNRKSELFKKYKIRFYNDLTGLYSGKKPEPLSDQFGVSPAENISGYYFYLRSLLIQKLTDRKYDESKHTAKKVIELIETHSHEFDKNPFQKMDVYFMAALSYLLSDQRDEFNHAYKEVLSTPINHSNLKSKIQERLHFLNWLGASLGKKDNFNYNIAIQEFQLIRKTISTEYEQRIIEQIANYFIEQEIYHKARKWNQIILNKPITEKFSHRALLRQILIAIKEEDFDLIRVITARLVSKTELINKFPLQISNDLKKLRIGQEINPNTLNSVIHFWKYPME
ncbi:MAG: hypothetical protein MK105_00280 [Crocinitomicaceae bacterium]|nr:hypothetical protein [Crocinitomicaceae bacterium]